MIVSLLFVLLIIILLLAYFKGKYNENYWKKRGVTFYDKHKTGGVYWQFFIENRGFFEILQDIYNSYKDAPAVGIGSFFDQTLYVKDPVNIQHITQSDFQSFYHRGVSITENDILGNNLIWLNGPKWKLIRQKLTSTFTAAKLKNMYYIVDRSSQDLIDFIKANPERLKENSYDTVTQYCAASVSAAVFGIGTGSTFDSPIRQRVIAAFEPSTAFNLKFTIGGISDTLYQALDLSLFGEHEKFFVEAIRQVIKQREIEGVQRHDLVDLCVKLQKNGTMVDPDTGLKLEPTDEVLAAQAFAFFLAGIEPSSSGMFATCMELGRNPEIQKRAQEEVDAVFEKYGNQPTYDAINELEYLAKVFNECLRLHSPIGFITRQCMKDSVLPVGNIHVEKNVKIVTPIRELHLDPNYFPNPEVFDPERFSRDGEISDDYYMPFGKGNRYCIGARFAKIQILSGVMYLLRNFTFNTYVRKGGIKYMKEQSQVRITNVDIEFIPRNK